MSNPGLSDIFKSYLEFQNFSSFITLYSYPAGKKHKVGLYKLNRRLCAHAVVASFPFSDTGRTWSPKVADHGGQFIAINFSITPN